MPRLKIFCVCDGGTRLRRKCYEHSPHMKPAQQRYDQKPARREYHRIKSRERYARKKREREWNEEWNREVDEIEAIRIAAEVVGINN